MIRHDVVHGSPEWYQLRAGRPTSSEFDKLITDATLSPANNDTCRKYMRTLIAELVMQEPIETVGSTYYMDRGNELEPAARAEYEFLRSVTVERGGFITDDDARYGTSPDGCVGEEGLVEFKCPKPENVIGYAVDKNLKDKYRAQLQGQLLVTGCQWVDIMAYHPQIKPFVQRVHRDEEYIGKLKAALDAFLKRMNAECEELIKTGYLVIEDHDPDTGEIQSTYMAG